MKKPIPLCGKEDRKRLTVTLGEILSSTMPLTLVKSNRRVGICCREKRAKLDHQHLPKGMKRIMAPRRLCWVLCASNAVAIIQHWTWYAIQRTVGAFLVPCPTVPMWT